MSASSWTIPPVSLAAEPGAALLGAASLLSCVAGGSVLAAALPWPLTGPLCLLVSLAGVVASCRINGWYGGSRVRRLQGADGRWWLLLSDGRCLEVAPCRGVLAGEALIATRLKPVSRQDGAGVYRFVALRCGHHPETWRRLCLGLRYPAGGCGSSTVSVAASASSG